ncbi:MAG: hypothetical protein NC204_05815 [Candidatus Amulumruptor caecigallinarius]|nr:hypothetical protein [Candidatus Amulumruptor caecigallinarius]
MSAIHYFNPDTDYALAANSEFYTAPASVIALKRKMALLPALYAHRGDIILIDDNSDDPSLSSLSFYDTAISKGVRILTVTELSDLADISGLIPEPWGWNRQVRKIFTDCNSGLRVPDDTTLDMIRMLSHRRTGIKMFQEMEDVISEEIDAPEEIFTVEAGVKAFEKDCNRFFKAPWSSSGRGVMLTDDLERKHVEPWLRGIIRRQGSVMMEKAYCRKLDFATEWRCREGEAVFLGYSVFTTSRRGKYRRNTIASQKELEQIIIDASSPAHTLTEKSPRWNHDMLMRQKLAIEKIITTGYNGPLGVDMLVTESGNVNPCVEMNFRHTMGMAPLTESYNPYSLNYEE